MTLSAKMTMSDLIHSCMPSPLAPDPIRVQSCVCCLFWTNRNCMPVTSFYLSHSPIRVMNPSIGAISKWKYYSTETILNNPSNLCLIKYELDINVFVSLNCLFSFVTCAILAFKKQWRNSQKWSLFNKKNVCMLHIFNRSKVWIGYL